MTIDQIITNLRQTRIERQRVIETVTGDLADIRNRGIAAGNGVVPPQTLATVNRLTSEAELARAAVDEIDSRIQECEAAKRQDEAQAALSRESYPAAARPAYDQVARIGSEARTYSRAANTMEQGRDGVRSFFGDLYAVQVRGDAGARERLDRHQVETVREGEVSQRATSTSSFGGLIVPQYLVDQAALVARASRPFANTCTRVPLPEQGLSLLIPRGSTGAAAAVQAVENTSVVSTDEVWGNLTLPVATIAGQQDVSRQSLERGTPGIDQLIYLDLAGAYSTTLDQQVLSGSGSAGQILGVFNTAGVNQATAYTAALTPGSFYTKMAGMISAVTSTRYLAPTWTAMHPRRAAWLAAQVDSTGRPLVVPGAQGPMNAMGTDPAATYGPGGGLIGLNVCTDASMPIAVGAGPEDQVLVYRAEDLLLFEDGDGMPRQLRFEQTLGNQLTVKLVSYGYVAFTAARFPAAVGIVGGNSAAGLGQTSPVF